MPTAYPDVYDYSTALAAHRRAGGRDRIKVGHNTYLLHDAYDGFFTIRYHATDIVAYRPDGLIQATTGGYETSTTVLRLNRHTPADVHFNRRNFAVHVNGEPMPVVFTIDRMPLAA